MVGGVVFEAISADHAEFSGGAGSPIDVAVVLDPIDEAFAATSFLPTVGALRMSFYGLATIAIRARFHDSPLEEVSDYVKRLFNHTPSKMKGTACATTMMVIGTASARMVCFIEYLGQRYFSLNQM